MDIHSINSSIVSFPSPQTRTFGSLDSTNEPQTDPVGNPKLTPSNEKTVETQASNSSGNSNGDQSTDSKKQQTSTAAKEEVSKAKSQAQQSVDEAELKEIESLKKRDREVRAHEAAHLAAAGKYATGGASYEYQRGPDGKNYAVGGEVGIDTSPIPGNPEATIQKARQIKSAANAPAQPSGQDRQVAVQAAQLETEARAEITTEQLEARQKTQQTGTEKPTKNDDGVDGEDKKASSENNQSKIDESYKVISDFNPEKKDQLLELVA